MWLWKSRWFAEQLAFQDVFVQSSPTNCSVYIGGTNQNTTGTYTYTYSITSSLQLKIDRFVQSKVYARFLDDSATSWKSDALSSKATALSGCESGTSVPCICDVTGSVSFLSGLIIKSLRPTPFAASMEGRWMAVLFVVPGGRKKAGPRLPHHRLEPDG